jgi:HAE1 family hydrophobic/amphiphilic exporter-1
MTEPSPPAPRADHRFASFLVGRPVTVTMLFLTLMGAGAISYMRIPLQLLPRGLASSSLSIWLPYPGAGPAEVQENIARPVEETLRTIPGITDIVSFSSEGGCDVSVEFGSSTDMDVAYGEVRDRIERIRPQLPQEMDRYRVRRFNSNTDLPVMWIGVQYDDQARDPFQPIEKIAVPRLEGVDGVANVQINGFIDDAVRIFVDLEKVRGSGVNLGDVIQGLQRDNFALPAGQVDEGQRTFQVRIDGRFHSEEDIRRYPIGGGRVLGDIAEVVRARAYRDFVWRINGRPAVGMAISRESDENTIAVCERLEQAIAGFGDDPRLQGTTFNVFWNQKDDILDAVHGLRDSGLWGGLFAVLVLFAFLRDIRLTLIASLAIPSSLLAAVMAVYFGDGTLNLISLTGFTLGIGMLVDNAIVVIESIAVKRARGAERLAAGGEGAGEVGLAVVASTLTSVVVFVPLVFMDGDRNVKIMMREVGLPISWSLLASLLVALVFVPAFTARLMRRRAPGRVDAGGLHSGPAMRRFRASLAWAVDHRFAACLLLVAVIGLSEMARQALPSSEMGEGEMNAIEIGVDLPPTFLLADANEAFRKLEAWAAEQEPLGIEFYSARFDRYGGDLRLWAYEDMPRDAFARLDDQLREKLPQFPGVELTLGWEGGGAGKQLRVNVTGPDFPTLARIAADLKARLKALQAPGPGGKATPLLDNVRTDIEEGLDEIHVAVDRDRASDLGVLPETIRGVVAWGLSGQRLPDLVEGEDETRVQIEYATGEEESVALLLNLGLPRSSGGSVPLGSIAGVDFTKAVGTLVRRNGRMTTGVSATPAVENVYLVSAGVDQAVRSYPFPEGYGWNEEGGRQDFEADMAALMKTLGLSILLIYLIMAILFESAILPLSILLSIPLAFMGVNLALWLADYPLDPMVVVGMVLLAGVVVNNAIVMIDLVQRLRVQGVPRREAILAGSVERLRPILMTALTTIFGLFPTAWPWMFPGAGQTSGYESMAITVMGGLAFSTFFTLYVVPIFYTFFDDLGALLARLLPWTRREAAAEGQPAGAAPAAALAAHGSGED